MLPQMVDILDEPIGDAAALNAYLICKAARAAGSKVLLSGMGADELFAGYRKHFACLLATRYRSLPRVLRRGLVEPLTSALPVASRHRGYRSVRWAKRFLTFANLSEGRAFHRSYTQFGEPELKRMLPHSLWAAIDALSQEHETLYQEGPSGDQINRMCYTDLRLFLPSLNLAYTDRASMAASTEVRVPFVDKEVVAAAFSIPGRKKIVGRERKAILKRAAEPELPREIVYRPKGLFSAPLRAWIRRDLREMVDDLLLSGELVRCGFLDRPSVRQVVDDDRANIADNSKQIWHLMTMELWLRNHAEARPRADTLRDAVRVGHA
jgi:asparagine synthase (glutamine-hydrolysing)